MDRRRFLLEGLNTCINIENIEKTYSLFEAFDDLNKLYEADETSKNNNTEEETNIKKESTKITTNEINDADAKKIISTLKDSDYASFVKILASDPKSQAFIKYLQQHYKLNDDTIQTIKKASASLGTVECSKLIPTQENISLSKSLGMINKDGWAVKIINTPEAAFNDPTIIYAGKYIIDGHHRWSKAYALNGGDCKIAVLNFPAIEDVSVVDMLKATQLAIVTKNPSAKLVNEVADDNMLKASDDVIKSFVLKNMCDAVFNAMKEKGRGDTKEAVAETIAKNVAEMRTTSSPMPGAAERAFMPQTDQAEGSIDLLSKAVVDLT